MQAAYPNLMNENITEEEITTGTTIMAVVYDKGVLIGADSRTSSGAYVADRCADKLDYVHDKIFCLRSGSAADTQALCRYVRYNINYHAVELGKLPHVYTAAKLFQSLVYRYKDDLQASIIIAGWDPYKGPQVYTVPLGGSLIQGNISIGGSGSGYMQGYVDANYRANMTFQEVRTFVINSISLAMSRDGSSGGIIRLVNITQDKNEREFIDHKDLPFPR